MVWEHYLEQFNSSFMQNITKPPTGTMKKSQMKLNFKETRTQFKATNRGSSKRFPSFITKPRFQVSESVSSTLTSLELKCNCVISNYNVESSTVRLEYFTSHNSSPCLPLYLWVSGKVCIYSILFRLYFAELH